MEETLQAGTLQQEGTSVPAGQERNLSRRSPTIALLTGLLITLVAVLAYSWYITAQIHRLKQLQHDYADRSRRDSLQLLRIQNDIGLMASATRDMLDGEEPYPLTAWSAQFDRIHADLDDAIAREEKTAPSVEESDQHKFFKQELAQYWDAVDRIFALARSGKDADARSEIRLSLQARQQGLSTAVARQLAENNSADEQAAQRSNEIYDRVQRQVYLFLAAVLVAIVLTSAYLIYSNRMLFARLAAVSEQRSDLAQKLIATQEGTLRHISRELHDDFGQILTAMGVMLGRVNKQSPEGSPLREDVREVQVMAQDALQKVRSLSQALHPTTLDETGLAKTLEWYLATLERQSDIRIHRETTGEANGETNGETTGEPAGETAAAGMEIISGEAAIHIFRILQEALNNMMRHSGAKEAWVRCAARATVLVFEVEDHGAGMRDTGATGARGGLGMTAMRERAEILHGTIEFLSPVEGGTLVRLTVPKENNQA